MSIKKTNTKEDDNRDDEVDAKLKKKRLNSLKQRRRRDAKNRTMTKGHS